MRDFEALRRMLNKEIDDDLIARGIQQAGPKWIELSSLNPAIRWSKYQGWAMAERGIVRDNEEAIEVFDNLLTPIAQEAFDEFAKSQQGIPCQWPSNGFAGMWLSWCLKHTANLRIITDRDLKDFGGYAAWYAGELATAVVENREPLGPPEYVNGIPTYKYFKDLK